jgi:serine/threonine-protein kinase
MYGMRDGQALNTGLLGVGTTFGRYTIDQLVASGGMGIVFRGRQRGAHGFERVVAIKTIHPALVADEEHRMRMLEEARIAARLRHDHVAELIDVCDENGVLFLVLEWIEGMSLRTMLRTLEKRGAAMPLPVLARIIDDLLDGLHYAHELTDPSGRLVDLVHRDISPDNALVTEQGTAKLIDFGIARIRDRLGSLTGTGEVLGKVSFMAPEQARGAKLDRRADVWGMGAVLRLCATGTLPHDAPSDMQRLYALSLGQDPTPMPSSTPVWLRDLCGRALATEPTARFATALAFRRELESSAGELASREEVASFVRALRADAPLVAAPAPRPGREPDPPLSEGMLTVPCPSPLAEDAATVTSPQSTPSLASPDAASPLRTADGDLSARRLPRSGWLAVVAVAAVVAMIAAGIGLRRRASVAAPEGSEPSRVPPTTIAEAAPLASTPSPPPQRATTPSAAPAREPAGGRPSHPRAIASSRGKAAGAFTDYGF